MNRRREQSAFDNLELINQLSLSACFHTSLRHGVTRAADYIFSKLLKLTVCAKPNVIRNTPEISNSRDGLALSRDAC